LEFIELRVQIPAPAPAPARVFAHVSFFLGYKKVVYATSNLNLI